MRAWFRCRTRGDRAQIDICGDVSVMHEDDHALTSRDFARALAVLPPFVRTIDLHLNSGGGNGLEAVRMAHALRVQRQRGRVIRARYQTPCASAVTFLACAASEVLIERRACLHLHPPVAPDLSVDLTPIAAQMIACYGWLLPWSAERIRALLESRPWLDADQAVSIGLAHGVYDHPGDVRLPFWSDSGVVKPAHARNGVVPERWREYFTDE